MAKESKDKVSLFGYDPTETPEEIIDADKDIERKDAFKEAYKRVMQIIPDYFINKKRKKNGTSSGGSGFTQNIIVTTENAKIETNKEVVKEVKEQEREREE